MNTLVVVLLLLTCTALSLPLGRWMKKVVEAPLEGGSPLGISDRLIGGITRTEQNWKQYFISMLLVNLWMGLAAWLVLTFQEHLPLNPDGKGAISWHLVMNTVISFVTNTNLQHYSGEVSLSYFSQMVLMGLQFLSPATGIAALVALSRALAGRKLVGNFHRDLLRIVLFILLPLSILVALALAMGGLPMTFEGSMVVQTLEGGRQVISRGPVAAFVAIKQLGTNGGGFFGPNSAHPFENPGFVTNFIEAACILLIPMASVWMFGQITRRATHATVIFAVMSTLLVGMIIAAQVSESHPASALSGLNVESYANLEGKELRLGVASSTIWAVLTTATSSGSVNCMHDSLNPLSGLVAMAGLWLNCVFGGVGVGFLNMFLFIIVGVFISGMMVGRSPEYLGRKVGIREMKYALLALLLHPLLILGGTALFAATSWGSSSIHNSFSHGFSEILYEFSSAAANNGSGFEGLSDNTVPWNLATGIVMLLARFLPILLPLAIAGSLSAGKAIPETSGTLRTETLLFACVMLGSVLLIGALLFLPVAALGPIAEELAASLQ